MPLGKLLEDFVFEQFRNYGTIFIKTRRKKHHFDIEVHHWNGTQGIFYDRDDILTISLATDPAHSSILLGQVMSLVLSGNTVLI